MQLRSGRYAGVAFPHNVLRRGALQYRGSSGVFFERYAVRPPLHVASVQRLTARPTRTYSNCICEAQVVVPQKMFVMYSQAASYPVHTLSLADAKPMHDGPARTVALQVHLCLRHVSDSIGAAGQLPM